MIYNVMATAKHWNRMSKNDQNTCLETPDRHNKILFFVQIHSIFTSKISLKNKVKKRLDNWEMPLFQCDNTFTTLVRDIWDTDDRLYQMSHCVSIPMIFVSAIFARLSRQMTRATLTAKIALTAKMRDCSWIAHISMRGLHLLPK